MQDFDFHLQTRVVFGAGSRQKLGELASELGFRRTLVVADRGIVNAGYASEAADMLSACGIEVWTFSNFHSDPDGTAVNNGCEFALPIRVDSIVGLGGGSSMDCAKGINFL